MDDAARGDRVATGIAMLHIVTKRYGMNRGHLAQLGIQSMMAHVWHGNLEVHLSGLDTIFSQLQEEPDPDLPLTLVEAQLRNCKDMEPDFNVYDRIGDNDPRKSVWFLYEAGKDIVARKRKEANFLATGTS